jgi:hypothetical protein
MKLPLIAEVVKLGITGLSLGSNYANLAVTIKRIALKLPTGSISLLDTVLCRGSSVQSRRDHF